MIRKLIVLAVSIGVVSLAFVVGRAIGPLGANASEGGEADVAAPNHEGASALADGVVTEDEYRAAFDWYLECAAQAGFVPASEIQTSRFGRLGVALTTAAPTNESAQAKQASLESCREANLNAVELAWVAAHAPNAAEVRDARDLTAACLGAHGVAISSSPTEEAFRELQRRALMADDAELRTAFGECASATADAMNWPGYIG